MHIALPPSSRRLAPVVLTAAVLALTSTGVARAAAPAPAGPAPAHVRHVAPPAAASIPRIRGAATDASARVAGV